jgi:transglutaminase-like putative cysteine protease
MLLELTHETVFEYSEPVRGSYMELRLTPITDASQHLLQHRQRITPGNVVRQYVDGWGNTVSYFNLIDPHDRIEVVFDSVVETYPTRHRGQPLAGSLHEPAARLALHDFLRPTALTEWCDEFREFVSPLERITGKPTGEASEIVRETIHNGFRYEGAVTNAFSPITDILNEGAGVCQDFAHLMLATCRYLGYPARYVSGYVLPDNGNEVEASHAWVEVFDPEQGWFGVDPTHNQWVEERHICLGVGRDYRDVPPNRGLYRGTGVEEMKVRVHLKPISNDALEQRARTVYPQTRASKPASRSSTKPQPMTLMQQTAQAQQQQQQQQ